VPIISGDFMPIYSPPSDLAFAQVREDYTVEMRVIDRLARTQNHPLRLLLIASGGCTALSLLTMPEVAEIEAVDTNTAQLHLVELRRQALLNLSIAEQLDLIGENFTTPESMRINLYNKIADRLPTTTRNYWDNHLSEIAFGVNRVGRFEQLFRELSARFTEAGLDPINDTDAAIQDDRWQSIFEAIFDRHQLIQTFGESAVNYSMDRSFGTHFADVFARSLQKYDPHQNYFITQVWRDRYADGVNGVPLYLQPQAQSSIHHLGTDRLKLHHGVFVEKMLELGSNKPFDLIQCSNISDWMPPQDLDQMLAQAVNLLNPGGGLIGRRLNGDHHLGSVMATHISVDEDFSRELLELDRSFFYREVVVGWKR
jgi:S-adenosylmethionine-diacylglycerol 3-amino-3-carboxypropyl transferase